MKRHSRFRKTPRVARAVIITPLGYRILRQVEAGTYKFAPGAKLRAGIRLHKGKRRAKFIAPKYK